jgi:hemolysin activation/secretion protein
MAQGLIGQTVPLAAVYDLAQRVTARYGHDGYILSRAIVPPQALSPSGAVVQIQIIEGYVDKVVWPPAVARYRDFFSDYAAKITADRPANVRTLERYLLLAGDLPGLKFKSSLKASASNPAAATLFVEVEEKPVDFLARLDNRGTKARGPGEFLVSSTFNNLLRQQEALTITWAGAFPLHELDFGALNYRQVLNSEGLTFFVNGSDSQSEPGRPVDPALHYRTPTVTLESGVAFPWVRTRERNLTLTALAFASNSEAFALNTKVTDDKLRGFRGKVDGDIADFLGGINQATFVLSKGIDGAGSSSAANVLASRAAGVVDFTKTELTLSRLQPLPYGFSTFVSGYWQYTSDPLLSPEQCSYGGRFFGRAYDPSQILGDQCIEAIGELRYDLAVPPPFLTQTQFYGFADWGRVDTIKPAIGTPPRVTAASAGAGLRLAGFNYFSTDLQVAKAIEGPRDDWRFFFILTARY